jgi:RHS repeat-associated protein
MHQHLRRPGAPQRQRCGGVWAQTFSYDAFGNVSKSGSISWQPNYTHPSNQYQSGWNGASYDNNGDLLNDTFNTYTWDVDGDLASANGAGITYDAFGRMVENHSGTYQFVYAPNGGKQPLAEMQGQSLLGTFLPLPGGAIAAYNSSGLLQYMHADWLGSARLSSTPGRAPIPAMAYAPFGEGYAGGQAYAQFTGINAGTVYDAENESGSLEDFMFRRYSPVQGRWISPDPAGLGAVDPGNPQSWNRYAYVMNSPLSAVDPLGLADGDYESHKGCTPGATSIVCPFGGQTCNIDGAPAPCNMISGSSGAFAVCPGGGCVFNEHGLFQYQQTSDDGGTWVRLNITSVDGGDSGAANIGTIRAGTLDQLNDYCSARGRAKFVADWLPGGGTLARNLWNSSTGAALGFYQLPTADINRITEENSGGQTVAMHATSEGLNAAAGSTALLYAMRAQTGVPMTVGSKMLSGAATVLLVIDAGIGYVKEGQEILNCQAGN